jgi:hypothetical protein
MEAVKRPLEDNVSIPPTKHFALSGYPVKVSGLVGELADFKEPSIRSLFGRYGTIRKVDMEPGSATIVYEMESEADACVAMDGTQIMG